MIKLSQKDLREKHDYVKKYTTKGNAASHSEVDPNANVDNKNIATLRSEINKDVNVQINRYILGEKIQELFDESTKLEYYRQLESHELYSHDESAIITPYCVAIDLYPFINDGNKTIGGSSKAPTNLQSFCGTYVNLIFLIAGQFAGAVADVSFLTYFDFFARKEYGDDYLKTNTKAIERYFKQVVYTLNDPSVGRGSQAVFYNTSIFDENYFKGLFSNVIFPDFTNPKWETVKELQKFFMHWFNKERNRALLTFPVITAAYQTSNSGEEDGYALDEDFQQFIAKEMSEGNSFFIYHSDDIDSLSSCCFKGEELIVVKDILENKEKTLKLKDFVNLYIESGEKKISDKFTTISYNTKTGDVEESKITGVLSKQVNEKIISITIGNKIIKVTSDHIFHVKNIIEDCFEEITASKLLLNPKNYLIPILL